jgi:8-oxo-dGTP pyrophosphatase MutT (NUDIX family)
MSVTATIKSVTCFLKCEDHFLFIHRTKKGNVADAGKLNGIGGKVERGEDFLTAAIRETQEETGVIVHPANCRLKAIVNMTEGYPDDWLMCFFTIKVPSRTLPTGLENDEGELMWLPKDQVLTSSFELVDDLHYCWEHLANDDTRILFAGCIVDPDETITKWQSRLL